MKEEITAIIILVLLLGMFAFNSYHTSVNTKKIANIIEEIDDGNTDENLTYNKVKKLKEEWTKEKKPFFYFCTHNTILEIDECMELSNEYMKINNKEKAIHYLKKAKVLLKDLSQREKIRLDNIF